MVNPAWILAICNWWSCAHYYADTLEDCQRMRSEAVETMKGDYTAVCKRNREEPIDVKEILK